jgi:ferredoxin
MKTGAFVCSCADTCDIDLEEAREGIRDVDVAASSSLLCEDGLPAMQQVIDEHDLDQLVVSCPEPGVQRKFRRLVEAQGLHPDAIEFVDQREGAGWVHGEADATDKTARKMNAAYAGLSAESPSRSVTREAGDAVAVVGDPGTAEALADTADVTLIANGGDYLDADRDLSDVTVERGRVVDVDGEFGGFELRLEARVTEECISCMECVRAGPDGAVTRYPVDVHPDAPDGEWTDVCPTDAIEMDGTTRTLEFDQVIHPGAPSPATGGRLGYYTQPPDGATIAAVEGLLGGVEKPKFLDLDMDVCASGKSGQQGCNACVEACPHDAVERPAVDSVAFDEVACQNCGACTSECPTGATTLREPSNERIAREVEALLTSETDDDGGGWLFDRGGSGVESEVVAFVCSERAERTLKEYGRAAAAGRINLEYPPVLPVSVNCTDTVGEAHVLHALAAGADGVAVVGCGSGCLHSGSDPKAELVDRLDTATTDLGLGERVTFLAPEPGEPHAFADELGAFVDALEDTPVPAGDHEAEGGAAAGDRSSGTEARIGPAFNNHDWALESVRVLLDHVDPERDVIRGLENFGWMTVSDDCTFTPTCSNLCPTDAIRRTETELEFNHERCVDCELCEEGCIENAIEMEGGLDLRLLPENRDGDPWRTVAEGEMRACARCGEEFTSEASAEKIESEVGDRVEGITGDSDENVFEYCNDCRAALMFG